MPRLTRHAAVLVAIFAALFWGAPNAALADAAASGVSQRSAMTVRFNGTRWVDVYSLAASQSTLGSSSPLSTVVNPVSASITDYIRTALSTPPGVTDFALSVVEYSGSQLDATFVVTRTLGKAELSNDEISSLLLSGNPSSVQASYVAYGGSVTDKVTAVNAGSRSAVAGACGSACQYGVGIAIPIALTAVLAIPIFVSLVATSKPFFSPRGKFLADKPRATGMVCCAKHAAEFTAFREADMAFMNGNYDGDAVENWMMANDGYGETGTVRSVGRVADPWGTQGAYDESRSVAENMEDDGYPANHPRQQEAAPEETEEDYYARVAQEAVEVERVRRDNENRWRRANSMPEIPTFQNSSRTPRVLVLEQEKMAANTFSADTMASLRKQQLESIPRTRPTGMSAYEREDMEVELEQIRQRAASDPAGAQTNRPRIRQEAEDANPLLLTYSATPFTASAAARGEFDGTIHHTYVPNRPMYGTPASRNLDAGPSENPYSSAPTRVAEEAPIVINEEPAITAEEEQETYHPQLTIASSIKDKKLTESAPTYGAHGASPQQQPKTVWSQPSSTLPEPIYSARPTTPAQLKDTGIRNAVVVPRYPALESEMEVQPQAYPTTHRTGSASGARRNPLRNSVDDSSVHLSRSASVSSNASAVSSASKRKGKK